MRLHDHSPVAIGIDGPLIELSAARPPTFNVIDLAPIVDRCRIRELVTEPREIVPRRNVIAHERRRIRVRAADDVRRVIGDCQRERLITFNR